VVYFQLIQEKGNYHEDTNNCGAGVGGRRGHDAGGCIFLLNSDPNVTLTSSLGGTSCPWGTDVYYYATATDRDDDAITLKWFLDDVEQTGVENFTSIIYIPNDAMDHTIRVEASDGYGGEDSASLNLYPYAASTLQIINDSNQAVTLVNIWPWLGTYDADANHISGTIDAFGGEVTLGIPSVNFDFYMESASYSWPNGSERTGAGAHTLTLANSGSFVYVPSIAPAALSPVGNVLRAVGK